MAYYISKNGEKIDMNHKSTPVKNESTTEQNIDRTDDVRFVLEECMKKITELSKKVDQVISDHKSMTTSIDELQNDINSVQNNMNDMEYSVQVLYDEKVSNNDISFIKYFENHFLTSCDITPVIVGRDVLKIYTSSTPGSNIHKDLNTIFCEYDILSKVLYTICTMTFEDCKFNKAQRLLKDHEKMMLTMYENVGNAIIQWYSTLEHND